MEAIFTVFHFFQIEFQLFLLKKVIFSQPFKNPQTVSSKIARLSVRQDVLNYLIIHLGPTGLDVSERNVSCLFQLFLLDFFPTQQTDEVYSRRFYFLFELVNMTLLWRP